MSFAAEVYRLLATKVPAGKVTTYKAIAEALHTKAYRAVGQVLNKNPHSWYTDKTVPCHRVIASDATIGGFAFGVQAKKDLLQQEGITFLGNKVEEKHILRKL